VSPASGTEATKPNGLYWFFPPLRGRFTGRSFARPGRSLPQERCLETVLLFGGLKYLFHSSPGLFFLKLSLGSFLPPQLVHQESRLPIGRRCFLVKVLYPHPRDVPLPFFSHLPHSTSSCFSFFSPSSVLSFLWSLEIPRSTFSSPFYFRTDPRASSL